MADKDQPDDNNRIVPAQIPLLDDIVDDAELPPKPRRKPKRENYDLDLTPDPPQSLDLFAEAEDDVDPFGIMQAGLEDDDIDIDISAEEIDAILGDDDEWLDVADSEADTEANTEISEEPDLPPTVSPSPSPSRDQLRTEAGKMVDHLVQEYSQEILTRLRDELTHLLDELDLDDESPD